MTSMRAATASWEQLVALPRDPVRHAAAMQASRTFEPSYGVLGEERGELLASAIRDVLNERRHLMVVHGSHPTFIPGILQEGFTWPRRRAADGFEPYEDKLAEWGALAPGERSEDFFFAGLRFVDKGASVRDAARATEQTWGGLQERVLGTGFGGGAVVLDPLRALPGATLVPAPHGRPYFGMTAGTIEHLPEVVAARIAGDNGALAAVEARGLVLRGKSPEHAFETERDYLPRLLERIDGPRSRLVDWVNDGALNRIQNGDNPLEVHVHDTARELAVHVDVVKPRASIQADRSYMVADVRGEDTTKMFGVSYRLGHSHMVELREAAERLGVPTTGVDEQIAVSEAVRSAKLVGRRVGEDRPMHFVNVPKQQTTVSTASLRQRMRAAREAVEQDPVAAARMQDAIDEARARVYSQPRREVN